MYYLCQVNEPRCKVKLVDKVGPPKKSSTGIDPEHWLLINTRPNPVSPGPLFLANNGPLVEKQFQLILNKFACIM